MKQVKHILVGILSVYALNISCQKNAVNATATPSKEVKPDSDTIIEKSGVYLISPDQKDIDSLKKAIGENQFYTAADDANFYISKISSGIKNKLPTLKYRKIDFKNEKFVFDKSKYQNNWLIIDYKSGKKPEIYSLVDFYGQQHSGSNSENLKNESDIESYQNNKDFIMMTFDINNDGKEDKVFSNKPNTGDSLIVYFYENNGYILKLKSINFSQDGGNQVSQIKKEGKGFSVVTNFPRGIDRYNYFISFENNNFMINKVVHEMSAWQDNNSEMKICEFQPKINLQESSDQIFNILIESEKKAVCFTRKMR